MRQLQDTLLAAASAAVDQTTGAINAENLFQISAQVVTTGTSTGALKMQFSNDIVNPSVPETAPTNWTDVTSATVTVSAAGAVGIMKTDLCYQWIRFVWTKNNGAAGLITVTVKALGA
jgi:hypothetical protein